MHPNSNKQSAVQPRLGPLHRLADRWSAFWFTPVDSLSLHIPRVVFGLVFLVNLLAIYGYRHELLGLSGWFDQVAYVEGVRIEGSHPNLTGWSPLFVASSDTLMTALYVGSIVVVSLFTIGVATRITGVLTWLAAVAFTTNPATSFGGDAVLLIVSFYMMLGYLFLGLRSGKGPSGWLGNWGLGLSQHALSVGAGTTVRLMQVHFAIMLVTSGLHKLQIGAWWAGVPLWFPLHPAFETTLDSLNVGSPNAYMTILSLGAYAILVWQLTFPFVAWRPNWKWWVVAGGVVAAVGCPAIYGLPLFGGLTLTGCLAFVDGRTYRRLLEGVFPAKTQATVRSEEIEPKSSPLAQAKSVA